MMDILGEKGGFCYTPKEVATAGPHLKCSLGRWFPKHSTTKFLGLWRKNTEGSGFSPFVCRGVIPNCNEHFLHEGKHVPHSEIRILHTCPSVPSPVKGGLRYWTSTTGDMWPVRHRGGARRHRNAVQLPCSTATDLKENQLGDALSWPLQLHRTVGLSCTIQHLP